jgi:hypothetical protein
MNLKEQIAREVENAKYANQHCVGTAERILRLFSVSNFVKIALLKQLEELSEHLPCEVYTKKVIEIKSNFNDC